MSTTLPPTVNYHLWQPCNMACRHCYARFEDVRQDVLPRGHLPRTQSLELVGLLAARFEKLTFAGGEPTLCPWLLDLIGAARARGAATNLVTNASLLDEAWLDRAQGQLTWLTLSIDSARADTHARMGRQTRRGPLAPERYLEVAALARARGMRVKVNTVVNRVNAGEDLTAFMEALSPERWKILQALEVGGQNDADMPALAIDAVAFDAFVERHRGVRGPTVVPEPVAAIMGTYAMVDPAGRFFDDTRGHHTYSAPILEVGLDQAWAGVSFDLAGFEARGGRYR